MESGRETDTILYEPTSEGITTITIKRPHVRNAVNSEAALSLAAAFRAFEVDASQKVCLLTGAGDTFCAGYDLHEVAAQGHSSQHGSDDSSKSKNSSAPSPSRPSSLRFHHGPVDSTDPATSPPAPMGPSRMRLSKPLIAAIAGHAVAGGLELSLLADVRIADETAVLGVFCRRFGVPLIDGGTVRLQRVVGLGRAMDMILSGRPVTAREALHIGLVNRVVERGSALREAREYARALLGFPWACLLADRRSTFHAAFDARNLEDALRYEYEHGIKIVEQESLAGAARFAKGEGRKGTFATDDNVKSRL
ncbi:hypothetical protein VTK73DRAFT_1902 [Phialemonium thermophilum]|uniref:Enoyl-CoA hydratase n=1 Tax=Phialemonium thermophilum TaxID=223376 RepID=A0ABR3Y3C5_9PEZI